jgi:hypothetical protein
MNSKKMILKKILIWNCTTSKLVLASETYDYTSNGSFNDLKIKKKDKKLKTKGNCLPHAFC